jgi:hypothetical protein
VKVRNNVDIVFLRSEPILDFSIYHLTREVPDDYLIASAIEFARENSLSLEQAVVITADLGLELKVGGQSQIVACPMPDSLRLPDEPDADERQITALQDQVKNLSAQLPDLKLELLRRFDGSETDMATVYWRDVSLTEEELDAHVNEEKKKNPYLCANPIPPPGYLFRRSDLRLLQQFNDYLNGYFALYRTYLKRSEETENWRSKTRALVFVLRNDGGISATDIRVTLKFPRGISIVADRAYKGYLNAPTPPVFESRAPSPPARENDDIYVEEDPSLHEIKIGNIRNFPEGSEVILTANNLRHTCEESRALNVHFREETDVHPFQLDYEIWMRNFPKLITGTLNVVVKAGNRSELDNPR